jgi:hypothetical protein
MVALLVVVALSCCWLGCKEDTTADSSSDTSNSSGTTDNTAATGESTGISAGMGTSPKDPAPVSKEEYIKMMADDTPVYQEKLNKLKAKAETLTGEEQKKFKETVAGVEERFNDCVKKFAEMDKESDQWVGYTGPMKMVWEEIKRDIDTALGTSADTTETDTGSSDTGTEDSGTEDSGTEDSGTEDSGTGEAQP